MGCLKLVMTLNSVVLVVSVDIVGSRRCDGELCVHVILMISQNFVNMVDVFDGGLHARLVKVFGASTALTLLNSLEPRVGFMLVSAI